MTQSDYNKIIREHFDISDSATRKFIVALEDSEQTQLLSALSSSLYDMIIKKVDKIDFGTIPTSRGDITKVEGFDNTVECLNVMRKLVLEYRQNPDIVDCVLTAIENIKTRKSIFMKAYALNVELPMVLYNLIVMSIEQSVSFLVSVCIQYIKDDTTKTIESALDKVAYNSTRENLLYEQLNSFNKACSNGDFDKVMTDLLKGGKIAEGVDVNGAQDGSAGVNTIVINVGSGSGIKAKVKPCGSPFQKFDDEDEEKKEEIQAISEEDPQEDFIGDDYVSEGIDSIGAKLGLAAAAISLGGFIITKGYKFIIGYLIPSMRNMTYVLINSVVKFSDTLTVQAQFLEINAYKLQSSTTSNLDDKKKDKVVERQLKIASKLKQFANKIAIDNKTSAKQAKKLADDEAKKLKIDDIKDQLPENMVWDGNLF